VMAKGGGPRRGPADMKQVLGDIPEQPQMSAFSFPGDPSSMPNPSSGAIVTLPRSVPNAPANPKLPRPPGRPGGAPLVDSTLNSEDVSAARRLPTPPQRPGGGIDAAGAELTEWRAVFQDFVSLKQQCGESIEGFSYDKFEQTLKKKNEDLLTRHGAKKVKFSVYVKEGKAALKASPIMD
jgi:hypothetical protein